MSYIFALLVFAVTKWNKAYLFIRYTDVFYTFMNINILKLHVSENCILRTLGDRKYPGSTESFRRSAKSVELFSLVSAYLSRARKDFESRAKSAHPSFEDEITRIRKYDEKVTRIVKSKNVMPLEIFLIVYQPQKCSRTMIYNMSFSEVSTLLNRNTFLFIN